MRHLKIRVLDIVTVMYICIVPFIYVTGAIVPSGISRRAILGLLVWILFLFEYANSKNRTLWDSLVVLFLVGLIFGVSYIRHPEYHSLYSEYVFGQIISGVSGVTGYVIMRRLEDINDLKRVLKACAYILFLYYFFRSFDVIIHGSWTVFDIGHASNAFSNSSMEFGYSMLFPSLLFLAFYITDNNRLYLIPSAIGIVETLLYGGRGPVLIYISFIVLYLVFVWIKDSEIRNKWLKVIGIIVLGLGFYGFYNYIVAFVINIFNSFGIKSRFLTYLANGEITADNGRTWIQNRARDLISQKSIFSGYGPLGDRYYIGYYSHSIIYELAVEFGVFFGTLLFFLLIFLILKSIVKCNNKEMRIFFILFVSCGLVKLFVSSTFWTETYFWMMVAMIVNIRHGYINGIAQTNDSYA